MTATKTRHLHAVTNHAPASVTPLPAAAKDKDVESLRETAEAIAERRARLRSIGRGYPHQDAHAAAKEQDVSEERETLLRLAAYRLGKPGANVRALLRELANANYAAGFTDGSGAEQARAETARLNPPTLLHPVGPDGSDPS